MVCIADSKDDTTNLVANISSHCHFMRLLVIGSREEGFRDTGRGKKEAQGYRWQLIDRIDWEKDVI